MKIDVHSRNIDFFKCFSSETKLGILELLSQAPRNISDLAQALQVSTTMITRNISSLEKAGIVTSELEPGKRGQQKICSLAHKEISLNFDTTEVTANQTTTLNIPLGQYSNYQVEPTCGLASKEKYIGMVDDPRYFSNPEKNNASILWFQAGFIEYTLPSYLFDKASDISSLTIALEIGSEFPGFNNEYPSDIMFHLNNQALGTWTSPGNFGDKKGFYTPEWFTCGTEYGLLKNIMINHKGAYIDGHRISDITLDDLALGSTNNQVLRISSPKNVAHPGGVTLFGKGFGNYDQDIIVKVSH